MFLRGRGTAACSLTFSRGTAEPAGKRMAALASRSLSAGNSVTLLSINDSMSFGNARPWEEPKRSTPTTSLLTSTPSRAPPEPELYVTRRMIFGLNSGGLHDDH